MEDTSTNNLPDVVTRGWEALEVVELQRSFRTFLDRLQTDPTDEKEVISWCFLLRNYELCVQLEEVAPEIVSNWPSTSIQIGNEQSESHLAILTRLRMDMATRPLSLTYPSNLRQRQRYERIRNYITSIFPSQVHNEAHELLDVMFAIRSATVFSDDTFPSDDGGSTDAGFLRILPHSERASSSATRMKHSHPALATCAPLTLHPHLRALCDRVFLELSALCVSKLDIYESTEFIKFDQKYRSWRLAESQLLDASRSDRQSEAPYMSTRDISASYQ